MNYYKRFPGDYQSDTAHLSMIEHGAYGLLLDYIYGSEKPVPSGRIYHICRAFSPDEQAACDSVIGQFFESVDGGYMNPRAEKEMAEDLPRIEAARINGRKGGRPRNKTQTEPSGFPNDNPTLNPDGTQVESSPTPTPTPTPSLEPTPKPKIKVKRFVPPTPKEVTEYAKSISFNLDGNHFVDYYATRGWELGKGRKMKDWKACVRTWKNNGHASGRKKPQKEPSAFEKSIQGAFNNEPPVIDIN